MLEMTALLSTHWRRSFGDRVLRGRFCEHLGGLTVPVVGARGACSDSVDTCAATIRSAARVASMKHATRLPHDSCYRSWAPIRRGRRAGRPPQHRPAQAAGSSGYQTGEE